MDDLLSEFLTETTESMDQLDQDLVALEKNPDDPTLLGNIFRLVHTIKGTCGFLGLPRLEGVAHSAENVLGKIRDGELKVSEEAVSLVLEALDKIKDLLAKLEENGVEPEGDDAELKRSLDAMADGGEAPVQPAAPDTATAVDQSANTAEEQMAAAIEAEGEIQSEPSDLSDAAATSVLGSLYEQLGGEESLRDICSSVLGKVTEDATLGPVFDDEDRDDLLAQMTVYYGQLLGGPDQASGHHGADLIITMKRLAEKGMDRTKLSAFTEHIQASLVGKGVWGPTVEEVMTLVDDNASGLVFESASKTDSSASNATASPTSNTTAVPATVEDAGPSATSSALASNAEEKKEVGSVASSTIRVSVDLLENLMTMVSEMVLTRNQLMQILRSHSESEFAAPLQRLNLITSELQEGVMKTRMQPIGNAWSKLPRIVRDLSRELDKKIHLEMNGEDTELDRQVLDLIKDPLTHMVRNSADHGIEHTEIRLSEGKPEQGTISLNAFHEGGHIVIKISDDGGGLNTEQIAQKAIDKGLATEAQLAEMNQKQIQSFIMQPGFSTAAMVTSVSGRGVGMDVVRTNIEKIGGTIELFSEEGKGTTFTIKIPLTLAIVSALIIECGGERFAIPQISVLELVRCSSQSELSIESINDTPVLRLRDRLLPLVPLVNLLHLDEPAHPLTYAFKTKDNKATLLSSDSANTNGKGVELGADADKADLEKMLASLGGPELAEHVAANALGHLRSDPLFKSLQDIFDDQEAVSALKSAFASLIGAPARFNPTVLSRLRVSLLERGFGNAHVDATAASLYEALSETDLDPVSMEKIANQFEKMRSAILGGSDISFGDTESVHDIRSPSQSLQTGFEDKFIIVSQVGTYTFGIIVDRVYDTEEIVVKPVAPILRDITLFSGNTILGDGSVIMILDPNGIAAATGEASMSEARTKVAAEQKSTEHESVSLLVFQAGDGAPKAVPLALIARLEEINLANIEYSHNTPMVQYRGSLMPLVAINDDYKIGTEGNQPVIVFTDRDRSMGLIVDEIVDIIDEVAKVELASESEGILGSAIVNENATDMIDAGYYLNKAFKQWFGSDEDGADAHRAKKILLVDDSPFFRNLLAPMLSVEGYDVTAVESPHRALQMCEKGMDFDIIVSDIEMPEMNGFEFARTVRNDTRWANIPIVALSSHATREDIERGREVGFNDYVTKNDRDGLLETLAETILVERSAL